MAASTGVIQAPVNEVSQDPWGGPWFRIHVDPFWNQFLKPGIEGRILDAAHFKVFLLLTTLMGSRNDVHHTQEQIASIVGLKPSRVSEVLRDLEGMGCLQRIGGRTKSAFIRLNPMLITRAARTTHLKAIDDWNQEAAHRTGDRIIHNHSDQTVDLADSESGAVIPPF